MLVRKTVSEGDSMEVWEIGCCMCGVLCFICWSGAAECMHEQNAKLSAAWAILPSREGRIVKNRWCCINDRTWPVAKVKVHNKLHDKILTLVHLFLSASSSRLLPSVWKWSCFKISPVPPLTSCDPWLLSRLKRERLGPHDWLSIPVSGGHDWMVVPSLEPETTYQFSILAQNKLGTGPFSEVVTVNTPGQWSPCCPTETKGLLQSNGFAWSSKSSLKQNVSYLFVKNVNVLNHQGSQRFFLIFNPRGHIREL